MSELFDMEIVETVEMVDDLFDLAIEESSEDEIALDDRAYTFGASFCCVTWR